ncbi:DUF5011 domain-containing protein [Clostridium gasigenes]|uniref:immunoglobulin-like domain-containing protein n=1 Tax=Clostridium gasigenes TaxID=94869 RepID=UPI001C0A978A|nr:immunoglobulin-like domain-containing protein [Clostridium gasigenes]MBU3135291.1 DUF5011 domain-containing protein [Clostridium gasigenes]
MTGISANDVEDGNITSNIVASGTVDTKKVGTYKVNYSITDKAGIIVTKDVIIYVISKEHSSAVIWNPGTTYTNKQKVVYEGKIYENISWWTPAGTLPTSTAHYKVIS